MENKSGIHPIGSTVLVLLDPVPESHGSIALPEKVIVANQLAQIRGTLIESGPLAWRSGMALKELSLPTSNGSRVILRRYSGELVTGADKVMYRIVADKDIYATFDIELPNEQA